MTDELSMALLDLVRKGGGVVDFLREGLRVLSNAVKEAEVTGHVGAERHERTSDRSGERNGYRERSWDTRVGTIDLKVPRVRDGSYFPALLEPRKCAEQALTAVVQEAYVHGMSTRRVDALVQALGMTGISKSQVSRMCTELDTAVEQFRTRPLTGAYPYVWLDATYLKVRDGHRVVAMAVVIAIAIRRSGEREVLGFDIGRSEDGAFWLSFLRSLVASGLSEVRAVISDAHQGLRSSVTPIRAYARPSPPSCMGRVGNAAGSISSATPCSSRPKRMPSLWRRAFAPSSSNRRGECPPAVATRRRWVPRSLSQARHPDG